MVVEGGGSLGCLQAFDVSHNLPTAPHIISDVLRVLAYSVGQGEEDVVQVVVISEV